jgi:hypothetical protein
MWPVRDLPAETADQAAFVEGRNRLTPSSRSESSVAERYDGAERRPAMNAPKKYSGWRPRRARRPLRQCVRDGDGLVCSATLRLFCGRSGGS